MKARAPDVLIVTGTPPNAATTINMGPGNNTLTINGDNGPTTVNSGRGKNTISIRATGASTTIKAATGGTDTITVSNSGRTNLINGPITVVGGWN